MWTKYESQSGNSRVIFKDLGMISGWLNRNYVRARALKSPRTSDDPAKMWHVFSLDLVAFHSRL